MCTFIFLVDTPKFLYKGVVLLTFSPTLYESNCFTSAIQYTIKVLFFSCLIVKNWNHSVIGVSLILSKVDYVIFYKVICISFSMALFLPNFFFELLIFSYWFVGIYMYWKCFLLFVICTLEKEHFQAEGTASENTLRYGRRIERTVGCFSPLYYFFSSRNLQLLYSEIPSFLYCFKEVLRPS